MSSKTDSMARRTEDGINSSGRANVESGLMVKQKGKKKWLIAVLAAVAAVIPVLVPDAAPLVGPLVELLDV